MAIKKYIYEFLDFDGSIANHKVVENDNSLAENAPPAEPEIIAPPAIYTEADMQIIRQSAIEEGIKQGQEQARAQFLDAEAKKSEVLNEIITKIEEKVLQEAQQTQLKIEALAEKLKPLALAAAKKMGEGGVEIFIKEQLQKLSSKGEMKVFISPANADMLATKFSNSEVLADENLSGNDFRIEWDGGYAERKTEEIWQEIENILRK